MDKEKIAPRKRKAATSAPDSGTPKPPPYKRVWKGHQEQPDPPMLGQKEVPEGKENCLLGLTFVMTGVLDSLIRDDASDLIKRYGGRVTKCISGKTSYLLKGDLEAGESKIRKAEEKKVAVIDEDGLFELLKTRASPNASQQAAASTTTVAKKQKDTQSDASFASLVRLRAGKLPVNVPDIKATTTTHVTTIAKPSTHIVKTTNTTTTANKNATKNPHPSPGAHAHVETDALAMWVDKYAPNHLDQVLGNKSLVTKMQHWLSSWSFETVDVKQHCLLLSGPPGTGKSTVARLVAAAAGYTVIEYNASSVRNKKTIQSHTHAMIGNRSVKEFFSRAHDGAPATVPHAQHRYGKTVLIMDEVDGMSGNADRGGVQAFIQAIKQTKIPIIAIANDMTVQKMKALKTHVTMLTWRRTPAVEIADRVLMICQAEGCRVAHHTVLRVAEQCHQDIRQVLHFFQMTHATQMYRNRASEALSSNDALTDESAKERLSLATTDVQLGPFEICPRFFRRLTTGDHKEWVSERQALYFTDADMLPLFVHENYLHCTPTVPADISNTAKQLLILDAFADASDSISRADVVGKLVYSQQSFELMPCHANLSCVLPGYYCSGGQAHTEFPSWLGKNSKTKKNDRLTRELRTVLSLFVSGGVSAMTLDYLPLLREQLICPLISSGRDGVNHVSALLNAYGLTREDWQTITESLRFSTTLDAKQIPSAIKATMTREFKKVAAPLKVIRPVTKKHTSSSTTIVKTRGARGTTRGGVRGGARRGSQVAAASAGTTSQSRGRGRGRGRGARGTKMPARGGRKAVVLSTTDRPRDRDDVEVDMNDDDNDNDDDGGATDAISALNEMGLEPERGRLSKVVSDDDNANKSPRISHTSLFF